MKKYAISTLKRKAAKSEKLIVVENDLVVKNIKCFRCGNKIYCEPASIGEDAPDGLLWYCNVCGEVNSSGVPEVMLRQWEREELQQSWTESEDGFPF